MAGDENVFSRASGVAVGTNAGVALTVAAVTNRRYGAAGIQYSGDAAAVVTIESPSSTVLWQKRYAAAFVDKARFDFGELEGTVSQALVFRISASTSNCEMNAQYYTKKQTP